MNKINWIKFAWTVVRYAATLLLGYLTGDGSMSAFLSM